MCKDNKNAATSSFSHHTFCMPDSTTVDRIEAMEGHPEIVRDTQSKKLTARDMTKTLVVNLFAGPGAGKSTTAAGIFFELKTHGVNCELVAEYTKDLCWEERHQTFRDQIYIFGKQYHRIYRILGQVECIITDGPILLTAIYDGEKRATLEKLVVEEHNKMWTYNAFLKRRKAFNPKGRNQNLEESQELDLMIAGILWKHQVAFETFEGTPEGKDSIVRKVLMLLNELPTR